MHPPNSCERRTHSKVAFGVSYLLFWNETASMTYAPFEWDLRRMQPSKWDTAYASGRRCCSGRERGFPGNAVHKTELLSQMLLYQTLYARWNENDIQNFLKTVGYQKYSDIKTPTPSLDSETCRAQPSVLLTPNQSNFLRRDLQFVMSQIQENNNTGKQLCSPNEPFVVVLEKGFKKKNEISPFGVDFEIYNFVDRFMPKHTHWLKYKKWKSIIGPL